MTVDSVTAASPTLAYVKPTVSEIRYGRMHFLITNQPSVLALGSFVKELKRNGVDVVVRVCKPTYPKERLERNHIRVIDWEFTDGAPPSPEIIDKWLELVREHFEPSYDKLRKASRDSGVLRAIRDHQQRASVMGKASTPPTRAGPPPRAIAVHCVAGLGRAPILVAIALLEAGLGCEDVIFLIRTNRRGALNETQLKFLRDYKPSGRLRKLRYASDAAAADAKARKSCAIM